MKVQFKLSQKLKTYSQMTSRWWFSDLGNKKLNQPQPTHDYTFENILSKGTAHLLHPYFVHPYNGNTITNGLFKNYPRNTHLSGAKSFSFILEHPETRTCCFVSIFCKTTNQITLSARLSTSRLIHWHQQGG